MRGLCLDQFAGAPGDVDAGCNPALWQVDQLHLKIFWRKVGYAAPVVVVHCFRAFFFSSATTRSTVFRHIWRRKASALMPWRKAAEAMCSASSGLKIICTRSWLSRGFGDRPAIVFLPVLLMPPNISSVSDRINPL